MKVKLIYGSEISFERVLNEYLAEIKTDDKARISDVKFFIHGGMPTYYALVLVSQID